MSHNTGKVLLRSLSRLSFDSVTSAIKHFYCGYGKPRNFHKSLAAFHRQFVSGIFVVIINKVVPVVICVFRVVGIIFRSFTVFRASVVLLGLDFFSDFRVHFLIFVIP